MTKTDAGRFFEDYRLGDVIRHAVPRTLSGGERALYHALYPARGALHSSDEFARACGLKAAPFDDLITFHTVFGNSGDFYITAMKWQPERSRELGCLLRPIVRIRV